MSRKLAIKRLTSSDLTIFKWHHKNFEAGNQKAINLNADVFVKSLYPILPELQAGRQGRIPIDLFIYGPGTNTLYNLQRKIIKNETYKNWRLNGEFIDNPEDNPERFNVLRAEDIVVLEFNGEGVPTSAKAVFIAGAIDADKVLYSLLNARLAGKSMIAIDGEDIEQIIAQANPSADHPIYQLSVDIDLEEAVRTGDVDLEKISQKPSLKRITKEDYFKAKRNAENIGQKGEEIIDDYLKKLRIADQILSFEWTSDINPVYPYDFKIVHKDNQHVHLDVKSTEGEFGRTIFISFNELKQMAHCERYDLYRIYELKETEAKLRIAKTMKPFAENILNILSSLPEGIKSDGISILPEILPFEEEIELRIDDAEE